MSLLEFFGVMRAGAIVLPILYPDFLINRANFPLLSPESQGNTTVIQLSFLKRLAETTGTRNQLHYAPGFHPGFDVGGFANVVPVIFNHVPE